MHINTTFDYLATFEKTMSDHGLVCPDPLIPDGHIQRFDVLGDRAGSKNGWYVLYDGENPTIVFGSWKTDQKITWSLKKPQDLSPDERKKYQQRIAQAQQEAERERKILQQEAAVRAQTRWNDSTPAPADHSYLSRKSIQPHGARVSNEELVIPAYDATGDIATLQFIGEDSTKQFLSGGAKTGNCYTIGEPENTVYLVEGFATGGTVYEATGTFTVVAFDAGNLKPVALRLRREYPDARIIIAADNDSATEGNPGLTKAKEAAVACKGSVVFPTFQSQTTNGKPPTDFNDLFVLEGLEVVQAQLALHEQAQLTLRDALLDYPAMLALQLPERKCLYPFLPEGGISMAYGPRGVGKTFFNLTMAASICTGTPFFRWKAPEPTGVLYVDGEMNLDELRGRMTALLSEPPKAPLTFLTSHHVYHTLQRDLVLTNADVRQEIISILDDNPELRVLILDNISCLFSGIDEDRKTAWEPINTWLISLRHRGMTVLLVHHAGKGGQQRGTSGREDSLDTVIQLNKPADYSQQEGCHFEISFTKCLSSQGR
jgi:putative DNA primase/helicase